MMTILDKPRCLIFLLITLQTAVLGCSTNKITNGPIEDHGCINDFVDTYTEAFEEFKEPHDRELLQLGLPTQNSVSIWYLLETEKSPTKAVKIILDGNEIITDRVSHRFNDTYKTGIIEIIGLNPGTAYHIKIINGSIASEATIIAYTKPIESGQQFSFLFGSCFQPYNYKKMIVRAKAHVDDALADYHVEAEGRFSEDIGTGLEEQITRKISVRVAQQNRLAELIENAMEDAPYEQMDISQLDTLSDVNHWRDILHSDDTDSAGADS